MQCWFVCVVTLLLSAVDTSLQHDGGDHSVDARGVLDDARGIPVGGLGRVGAVGGIAPGFGPSKDFGRPGSYDGFIDGNNGFVNNRGGLVGGGQDFLSGGPGFGGGDGFISGTDNFGANTGYDGSGMTTVGPTGGFNNGGRFDRNDRSLIGDYNSFQDPRSGYMDNMGGFGKDFGAGGISAGGIGGPGIGGPGLGGPGVGGLGLGGPGVGGPGLGAPGIGGSGIGGFGGGGIDGGGFNDPNGFMDFGMGGQYDNGRYDVTDGFGGYMDMGGSDYRGVDGAVGSGGYLSPGGSNRMVPEYSHMRYDDRAGIGGRKRGYDGKYKPPVKLRGFTPGLPPFGQGETGIGSGPILEPRPSHGRVEAIGSKDRVLGFKSGATTHHSKLTTVVRPIVRPIIRPVVRPVIQRIVRPIIRRPVIQRVVRPIVRPVINRIVRPNLRPLAPGGGRPDIGETGVGSPPSRYPSFPGGYHRRPGMKDYHKQPYKPSYKRTKYY